MAVGWIHCQAGREVGGGPDNGAVAGVAVADVQGGDGGAFRAGLGAGVGDGDGAGRVDGPAEDVGIVVGAVGDGDAGVVISGGQRRGNRAGDQAGARIDAGARGESGGGVAQRARVGIGGGDGYGSNVAGIEGLGSGVDDRNWAGHAPCKGIRARVSAVAGGDDGVPAAAGAGGARDRTGAGIDRYPRGQAGSGPAGDAVTLGSIGRGHRHVDGVAFIVALVAGVGHRYRRVDADRPVEGFIINVGAVAGEQLHRIRAIGAGPPSRRCR